MNAPHEPRPGLPEQSAPPPRLPPRAIWAPRRPSPGNSQARSLPFGDLRSETLDWNDRRPAPMVGCQTCRYFGDELLSSRGNGSVYKARHTKTQPGRAPK